MVEMEPKKGNEMVAPQGTAPANTNSNAKALAKVASPAKYPLIEENHVVFIQVSFLYTNSNRERVLRIINHGVKVSNSLSEIYENCDYVVLGNSRVL